MVEILLALTLVLVASVALTYRCSRGDRRLYVAALVVHLGASWLIIELTKSYFGGGDLIGYHRGGQEIATLLESDFGRWAGPVLEYTLGQQVPLPTSTPITGNTTASTVGLCGWIMWLTSTRSIYALSILGSFLALWGQWCIYLVLRRRFPTLPKAALAVCALFVPSTTYWASGPTKEAFAVFGLGFLLAGLDGLERGDSRLKTVLYFGFGSVFAGLTKPYVLLPLGVAVWAYWYFSVAIRRDGRLRLRPGRLVGAALLAFATVALLGEVFPRFAYEQVASEFAQLQTYAGRGGSGYEIGDPTARSFLEQLVFAPVGLVFTFLRPTLFEIKNAAMAASAVETALCIVLIFRLIIRAGISRPVQWVLSDPNLTAFCVFVLMFGISIGLSTTNFGTLSRYRAPMMPFYAVLLVALNLRVSRRVVPTRTFAPAQR